MIATNSSKTPISFSGKLPQSSLSNDIPLLRSQTHSRPAMLSFSHFPTNADTVSQPVNAWKNDNAFDLGPRDLTIE